MSAAESNKEKKMKVSPSGGKNKKSVKKESSKKAVSNSSASEQNKTSQPVTEKDSLREIPETKEAGFKAVEEKLSGIAEKTSETAGEVYQAIKKGLSTAYDIGAKVVDEITQSTQEYIDKYKHNLEIKKLSETRDKLTTNLGQTTFTKYKSQEPTPHKLMEEKEIRDLIKEIEKLDREILKVGKALEKEK